MTRRLPISRARARYLSSKKLDVQRLKRIRFDKVWSTVAAGLPRRFHDGEEGLATARALTQAAAQHSRMVAERTGLIGRRSGTLAFSVRAIFLFLFI